MTLDQLDHVLGSIFRETGVNEFVVIGSLSILGLVGVHIPARMTFSNDVDAYPARDPGRASELAKKWGEDSEFYSENGYYFDAAGPALAALPLGWEERVLRVTLKSGVLVKFLEPNDCAVSKYARMDAKDREWIRAGIRASILSLATIEYRMRETLFPDYAEQSRAKNALAEDIEWFAALISDGGGGSAAG